MINIYKIHINVILKILLFGLMLVTQSCSNSDLVIDKNLQQGTSENSNRRAPEDNIQRNQSVEVVKDTSLKRADKNYDVYQNYQSNNPPVSLSDLKKLKRHPVLNARELNTRQHKHPKKKKAKAPHVDGNCNLQEVINYNKQQQKTESTATPTSVVTTSAKVPEAKPETTKPITTITTPKVDITKTLNKVNSETKPEVKTVKAEQAVLPKVSLPELKSIKQKTKENDANPLTPAAPSDSSTPADPAPTTVAPAPLPVVTAPVIKTPNPPAKSVLVPIPSVTVMPIQTPAPVALTPPPISSNNLKGVTPAPSQVDTTKDVSNLSQADLEKMLKEKFAKNRPKEFIEDGQGNSSLPAQFNKNLLNEDELNEDIVQSSGSSPAVSKIRSFYKESRLSKINTLLISYYFQLKHKIISLFFGDDV